jgi:hypothetical protein
MSAGSLLFSRVVEYTTPPLHYSYLYGREEMGSGNDDVGRDMSHARPLRFSTTQIDTIPQDRQIVIILLPNSDLSHTNKNHRKTQFRLTRM